MTYKKFKSLKIGDFVYPKGRCKDIGRLYRVVATEGNDIICEVLYGKLTFTTYLNEGNNYINETTRRYKYHIMEK